MADESAVRARKPASPETGSLGCGKCLGTKQIADLSTCASCLRTMGVRFRFLATPFFLCSSVRSDRHLIRSDLETLILFLCFLHAQFGSARRTTKSSLAFRILTINSDNLKRGRLRRHMPRRPTRNWSYQIVTTRGRMMSPSEVTLLTSLTVCVMDLIYFAYLKLVSLARHSMDD
jgi:hypothetical protein